MSTTLQDRLFISFSGGRTSAYMTKRLLEELPPTTEAVVLFANTGREHEQTLSFVHQCDQAFGFNTVWIEAITDPQRGVGQRAKVVTFETASRNGEPFEAVIAKHGIPNRNFPHCTRETKLRPMEAYLRSIGWEAGSYDTAIGIRADEADRVSIRSAERRVVYPLIRWNVREPDILAWWRQQPFDLVLRRHWGNCRTCWKKTERKLLTIMEEDPSAFDWDEQMEAKYSDAGPGVLDRPRRFHRGNRSVVDLRARAAQGFEPYRDGAYRFDLTEDDLDRPGGNCSESCELFSDEEASLFAYFGRQGASGEAA